MRRNQFGAPMNGSSDGLFCFCFIFLLNCDCRWFCLLMMGIEYYEQINAMATQLY